jgi:hypothetical protein
MSIICKHQLARSPSPLGGARTVRRDASRARAFDLFLLHRRATATKNTVPIKIEQVLVFYNEFDGTTMVISSHVAYEGHYRPDGRGCQRSDSNDCNHVHNSP